MAKSKVLICPYCGDTQPAGDRCRVCAGLFDALSRQATHNEMGPWYVRDEDRTFQPGCSYETLVRLVEKGTVTRYTIVRGPTTRQFWTIAKRVPGISHLLGYCHQCDASVDTDVHGCPSCGAVFGAYLDRDYLGLPEVRAMPWEADIESPEQRMAAPRPVMNGGSHSRMSSFASNEELLGEGGSTVTAQPAPAPALHARPPGDDSGPTETVTVEDDYLTGSATRALQRALARQRRTVRLLSGLLAITAVLMVVLTFTTFGGSDDESTPPTNGTQQTVEPATATPIPDLTPPASETPPRSDGPDADAAPADPTVDPPVTVSRWQEAIDDAATLAAKGADDSNDIADRIAAYEQAIALLESIEAEAPARLGVMERLERVTRDLERLRLEDFFPDSDGGG